MTPILNTNPNVKLGPSVKLGDILTGEQIEKTITLMNSGLRQDEVHRRLRELYELDRERLVQAGALPEYLAYAIPFHLTEAMKILAVNN